MNLRSIASALLLVALVLNGCTQQNTEVKVGNSPSTLADSKLFLFTRNSKYGYIDRTGKIIIPAKFENASDFSEGLAIVYTGKKLGSGYINRTGKIVIPANKFEYGGDFSEGLAVVSISEKYGCIDKNGNLVIPARFKWIGDFKNGVAKARIDQSRYETIEIDRNGNIVADRVKEDKDKTDKVIPQFDVSQFDSGAKQFSDGMAWVKDKQDRIGYADKQGRLVIPAKYDWIRYPDDQNDFHDGLARVCLNRKCGYMDRTGKVVIPLKFDEAAAKFSDGLAWVVINKQLGYIDRTGNVKIPARFGHSGYPGKINDPTRFSTGGMLKVYDFQHGLAAVQIPIPASCKSDGSCDRYRSGYIDTSGKLVFEF